MWFIVLLLTFSVADGSNRPHIVYILADDLGWNDVGFHGSNQIPTPNIDALAYAGLPLHNYYVSPICTPSRSALMTGKYPIHTGMQHGVLYGMEARGLPLSEKLLPQYLKELGYKTHLVGKWHLGSYRKEYLPKSRGFDTHTGFITGKIDMYDHTNVEQGTWGFDFKRDSDALVSDDLFGKYVTDIFTDEAVQIISMHNKTDPLFLMVAHSAVHSGNPYEPIRAPDSVIDKFTYIQNRQRQKFAGVLTKLDQSVGRVLAALQTHSMLHNTVLVFSSDNGGPAAGFNDNAASNFPLRGVKNTLWEGGVRAAGLIFSPLLQKRSHVATQLMDISDWLPTLYSAAGGNVTQLGSIDGVDQWEALSKDLDSVRTEVLHNIDDIWGLAALTVWPWKLIQGTNYNGTWDGWFGPNGRQGSYNISKVFDSPAGRTLKGLGYMPSAGTVGQMRKAATVKCDYSAPKVKCQPLQAPCLFNVQQDPCEMNNLAASLPSILQRLASSLSQYNATAAPAHPPKLDPRGNPKFWGRLYFNFGDFINITTNTR
ncbi:arylsulfatase J [Plodia interpunctella]|uniref:arylsulfatase J n=1 Tax=Plodia interpunctella TaxID=58824 RepID=UPI0023688586|nr:arylsulfatase J-like [Plodia interpunctella]